MKNIPDNQPVILAPNHQNALMDAMVLVCNTSRQNVFLARADIFKGKRLIRFLTYLNIMPIYRIRDGIEKVKRNDEVFEKTIQVINNGNSPLVLFAEGNHGDRRKLRPLVKGLFRIAYQAQEKYGDQPGVKIVPIGIDYSHYQNFRTTLFVNVGEPIEVAPYFKDYLENPVSAISKLKDAYAAALSKQMIDIQTEEYYDLYMNLRGIFNEDMKAVLGIHEKSLAGKFRADKVMIEILNRELSAKPENISMLNEIVQGYTREVRKNGFRDWVFRKEKFSFAGLLLSTLLKIILFPVFLFGLINNCLPYWFTGSKVANIKDTQFHSSFKYVVGMIVFPVWYLVIAGILAFLSLPIWLIALYILILPVAGLASFKYYIRIKKLKAKFRYTMMRNSPGIINLRSKRKSILDLMHMIIKHQNDPI